jgi:hypothetical protein
MSEEQAKPAASVKDILPDYVNFIEEHSQPIPVDTRPDQKQNRSDNVDMIALWMFRKTVEEFRHAPPMYVSPATLRPKKEDESHSQSSAE